MSYYLAGSYRRREEIEKYALWLRDKGYIITSTWHDGHHELPGLAEQHHTDAYRAMCAKEDLFDLDKSDTLLFFSGGDTHRGGRHTEYGYALARHKTIFIVGPAENVFHTLADYHYDTWEDFASGIHEAAHTEDIYGNPI